MRGEEKRGERARRGGFSSPQVSPAPHLVEGRGVDAALALQGPGLHLRLGLLEAVPAGPVPEPKRAVVAGWEGTSKEEGKRRRRGKGAGSET